jgi:ribosomal protein S18 acetylase RimI-like enzyme
MSSATIADLEIRRAERSDVDAMAQAHRDSIQSIGRAFYPPGDVDAWKGGLTGVVYLNAMDGGEVFFVATGRVDGTRAVLGFASDYCVEGATHGTSVYVRGLAARRGIGTALLQRAEGYAAANGARSIQLEASLAGVEFYRANGYTEVGRRETRWMSGHAIGVTLSASNTAAADERRRRAPR